MSQLNWTLPIPTISEANVSQHWSVKAKRQKAQKALLTLRWKKERPQIKFPCTVKLTRLAPRKLDDDNLMVAFKHIRDVFADLLIPGLAPGRADGNSNITWAYGQEKSPIRGVRVEVS